MDNPAFDFGMVGLGTMGRNLLLNVADHNFAAIGFDKDIEKGKLLESNATDGTSVKAADSLADMVNALKIPRKIMMLVPAGPAVDAVIKDLLPLVAEGDIIIDGGNSHFSDTLRRIKFLQDKQIHFMGIGISGGEQGARTGPSIMPGGDVTAWKEVKDVLESVAAKVNGDPCVAYMGKDAAGNYVKMVHNGIEYGIMQLISEAYDFLKRGLLLSNEEIHEVFDGWNKGDLQSFLMEITTAIFTKKDFIDSNTYLVDKILDKAGSKGTGKWTSQEAMDLAVSLPTIDMAVALRDLSGNKEERVIAAEIYKPKNRTFPNKERLISQLGDGLYSAILICYAQGLTMLTKASVERKMEIPLKDVVKIWRGGCIIRSSMLEIFAAAYKKNTALANILLDKKIAGLLKKKQTGLRKIVPQFAAARIPAAAMMSALAYLDAYTSERLPINLVQAQRDFFGAHTYQRIDQQGSFHTEWQ